MVLSRSTQIFTGVIVGPYYDSMFSLCRSHLRQTHRSLNHDRNKIEVTRAPEQKTMQCEACTNSGPYIP